MTTVHRPEPYSIRNSWRKWLRVTPNNGRKICSSDLSRQACRRGSATERHPSVDRRAGLGMRLDRQFAINQLQTLLHAGEAKPASFHRLDWIKPNPRIMHSQNDIIRFAA